MTPGEYGGLAPGPSRIVTLAKAGALAGAVHKQRTLASSARVTSGIWVMSGVFRAITWTSIHSGVTPAQAGPRFRLQSFPLPEMTPNNHTRLDIDLVIAQPAHLGGGAAENVGGA